MNYWIEPDPGFWRMRDGSQIAIEDMSDSHLKNALRFQQRAAAKQVALENIKMIYGYHPTGDMADLHFANAQIELLERTSWEDYVFACFAEMVKEAEKRKLNWEPYSEESLELMQYNTEFLLLTMMNREKK